MLEMIKSMSISPEEIYRYGSWVFVFWIATFLVRKMWDLFEGRLKDIDNNVTENKRLNKDITVIQAQISKKLIEHDNCSKDTWKEVFGLFRQLTEFLNGSNPKIAEMQKRLDNVEKSIGKKFPDKK